MIIEFPTFANHGYSNADGSASEHHCCGCWSVKVNEADPFNHGYSNADGSASEHHCCGCWSVKVNEADPFKPYVSCNECGDVRTFAPPPGVDIA